MATFSHRTVTSTRHEWRVPAAEPWGAAAEEISKAWGAATTTYRDINNLPADAVLSGNALTFHVADDEDEIVISFVTETPGGAS
jgi:hypothetical protein